MIMTVSKYLKIPHMPTHARIKHTRHGRPARSDWSRRAVRRRSLHSVPMPATWAAPSPTGCARRAPTAPGRSWRRYRISYTRVFDACIDTDNRVIRIVRLITNVIVKRLTQIAENQRQVQRGPAGNALQEEGRPPLQLLKFGCEMPFSTVCGQGIRIEMLTYLHFESILDPWKLIWGLHVRLSRLKINRWWQYIIRCHNHGLKFCCTTYAFFGWLKLSIFDNVLTILISCN